LYQKHFDLGKTRSATTDYVTWKATVDVCNRIVWGNAIFVSVIVGVFTLSFVPRIVLTKLNNYIIPFFLIWRL